MDASARPPVPVFPLPGVVLFPHATLPLHIFELRYRTMVRDALSRDRMLAMALLEPGWERDYHGSPGFHSLGCVGRIERIEWLPNDCYNLLLVGTTRVRLGAVTREFPYRAVRALPLPQHPVSDDDPLVLVEKQALRDAFQRWLAARPGEERPVVALPATLGLEPLTNVLCTALDADPHEKLGWLELDSVVERAHRARLWIERTLRDSGRPDANGGEHN